MTQSQQKISKNKYKGTIEVTLPNSENKSDLFNIEPRRSMDYQFQN